MTFAVSPCPHRSSKTLLLGGHSSAPRDLEQRAVGAQCVCPTAAGQPAELPGAGLHGPVAMAAARVADGVRPTWCVATVARMTEDKILPAQDPPGWQVAE